MEEKFVETLYTCGKSALNAVLLLQEDGQMVIRDEAGSEVFVDKWYTPQKAKECFHDLYLYGKEDLLDEYSWNEMEKEKAASQDRKANYRDEEYLTFCSSIQKLLVQ